MKKTTLTGPTYLTIVRMVLSVVFFALALTPEVWAKIVALILFIAASITDLIDGKWARKKKIVTDLGAFLDPLVFAIVLVRDFAVDGMRMMAAREGVTISASIYGKIKTVTQMTALIILLLNLIVHVDLFTILGNIALYLALAMTVFSGLDYIIKGWKSVIK